MPETISPDMLTTILNEYVKQKGVSIDFFFFLIVAFQHTTYKISYYFRPLVLSTNIQKQQVNNVSLKLLISKG